MNSKVFRFKKSFYFEVNTHSIRNLLSENSNECMTVGSKYLFLFYFIFSNTFCLQMNSKVFRFKKSIYFEVIGTKTMVSSKSIFILSTASS